MIEKEESSGLLITCKNKDLLKRFLFELVHSLEEKNKTEWIKEIETLDGLDGIVKTKNPLAIENKYFRANVDVYLSSDLAEEPTWGHGYDGFLSIIEENETPEDWKKCGELEGLMLRIVLVNSKDPTKFDLDSHMETMPTFTETVVDNIWTSTESSRSKDKNSEAGMARVLESIQEATWRGFERKKDDPKPKPVILSEPAEAKPTNSAANKEMQEELEDEGLNKLEGDMEDDMRIFDEIMAFKSVSGDIPPEERRKRAEEIMMKLIGKYDEI